MRSAEAAAILDGYRAFINANLERWELLFQELIRIPSLFEAEHELVERVARQIESLGLKAEKVTHRAEALSELPTAQYPISELPERHSLVARLRGDGSGARSLIINTHMDIVPEGDPAAWTHPPFSGHIDRERNIIYGRGAMDDKAGVTASLAIMETLCKADVRLPGDVIFQYVLEDEITGNGSLLCLEAGFGGDGALIMDGTRTDKAINEHAGQLQFEIVLKGKPASVSVSHMGTNAAEWMARLVIQLREAVFALNAGRVEPWTRFPSPYQFVLQKIQSEGAQLTVPELSVAQCYVTFPPQFSLASMRRFLEQQAEAFAASSATSIEPRLVWNGFATEPVRSSTAQLEQSLQESAARLGMAAIDVGPSTGTSDMRHFSLAGIPCMLYGPGNGYNPHRPDEHYYLDDLPRIILFYLAFAHSWCR
ncbi:MAG TPA: M20/M25/M40 family metallo-hydrolase [Pyrinomonadaceae bacterium]|jgi:acetylornithine deacetylase|nr:M20/M25/M40 family metallo-hydrolase [Pyrinomonadaceae bacterium]